MDEHTELNEAADAGETTEEQVEETGFEAQYLETLDRYQRTLAEFDNFRKRTIKEKAAQYDDGLRAAAERLLPIIDNFERALKTAADAEDAFYQGITMIARQFESMLADIGVEVIAAEPGTPFDHNFHHAVAHVEDESLGTGVIAEVLQTGYKHKDKILRPSMVKAAN